MIGWTKTDRLEPSGENSENTCTTDRLWTTCKKATGVWAVPLDQTLLRCQSELNDNQSYVDLCFSAAVLSNLRANRSIEPRWRPFEFFDEVSNIFLRALKGCHFRFPQTTSKHEQVEIPWVFDKIMRLRLKSQDSCWQKSVQNSAVEKSVFFELQTDFFPSQNDQLHPRANSWFLSWLL